MTASLDNSYYAASAQPFPAQPVLQGEHQADVCVIGGGFTGLSTALCCAEAGFDTILIEADVIGGGASGRNGGQLIPGLNVEAEYLAKMLGDEDGLRLYKLAASARDSVHNRIAKHDIDCDLRDGHFHIAAKKADFEAMDREYSYATAKLGAAGLELIPAASVEDYVAVDGYHGGIFNHQGGHFHPLKYARGLAQAATDAGARLFEHSRVISVGDDKAPVVKANEGAVKAKHVVLACDSFMEGLSREIGSHTMPVLNYIIATEPLSEERARSLIPSGAAISDSRFVINYFRLSADQRLLFAGGEKYTPYPPADIAAFVRPYMLKLFPQLSDIKIDYAWGGAVGITVNRLPHFGRRGNVFFAHGYSGQGTLLTTLAGELIAEAIAGTAGRFDLFSSIKHQQFPGGQLLRSPLYVAGMLYYAMRDRL